MMTETKTNRNTHTHIDSFYGILNEWIEKGLLKWTFSNSDIYCKLEQFAIRMPMSTILINQAMQKNDSIVVFSMNIV